MDNLGLTYEALGDLDSALYWHQANLQYAREIGMIKRCAKTLCSIADIHFERGEKNLGSDALAQAKVHFEQLSEGERSWHELDEEYHQAFYDYHIQNQQPTEADYHLRKITGHR